MRKALIIAEQVFPYGCISDNISYCGTMLGRYAFVKGYDKAIDNAVEWLYQRQAVDLEVSDIDKFINDFKKAMEG